MGLEVLKSKSEIESARAELERRGLAVSNPWWRRVAHRLRLSETPLVGDPVKSWDVLKSATFIEANVPKQAAILDIGAYASEILCVLRRMGYANLAGVDLNPGIKSMPYADQIRYEVADFQRTPFPDRSFDVITATSVIEHGFNGDSLLTEVRRLLRPSGYFVASFDYWPEKIDTDGIKLFGMDWKIFSKEDVQDFVSIASRYGLAPLGNLALEATERAIQHAERSYTFAWIVLKNWNQRAPLDK